MFIQGMRGEDSFHYESHQALVYQKQIVVSLLLESSAGWYWLLCDLLAIWSDRGWWFALARSLRYRFGDSLENGEKRWEFSVVY